jgi:hypothetical protein
MATRLAPFYQKFQLNTCWFNLFDNLCSLKIINLWWWNKNKSFSWCIDTSRTSTYLFVLKSKMHMCVKLASVIDNRISDVMPVSDEMGYVAFHPLYDWAEMIDGCSYNLLYRCQDLLDCACSLCDIRTRCADGAVSCINQRIVHNLCDVDWIELQFAGMQWCRARLGLRFNT